LKFNVATVLDSVRGCDLFRFCTRLWQLRFCARLWHR